MNTTMMKRCIAWSVVGAAGAWLVGCATAPSDAETSAKAAQVMKASFNARGQAGLDRLDQDETQKLCTDYKTKAPPRDVAEKIEKIYEEVGGFGVLLVFGFDYKHKPEAWHNSLRLLKQEVLPRLQHLKPGIGKAA